MSRSKRTGQAGFSLIELLIVLAILAISANLAIPGFQGMQGRQRLVAASEQVYGMLSLAKGEARKRGTEITLDIAIDAGDSTDWALGLRDTAASAAACDPTTAGSCTLSFREADGSLRQQEKVLRSSDYPGVTLAANRADIHFDPVRSTASALTFTLTGGGRSVLVRLSATGRVRVCSSDLGRYTPC